MVLWYRLVGQVFGLLSTKWTVSGHLVVRGGHSTPSVYLYIASKRCLKEVQVNGTGKAGENGQSSVWIAKFMLDQTVGYNIREGGCCWVN